MAEGEPLESLQSAVYVVPTESPEADGTLSWDKTTVVTVTATAGGVTGTGWTYSASGAQAVINDVLAGVAVGRSMADVAALNEDMYRAVRNFGARGIAATAISAVDIALWDLQARLAGLSVTELLGEPASVPIYGSGGFTSYDARQLSDQLAGWVHGQHIPRVKIKIGEAWGTNESRDLERTELARSVIGPDAELYVDANGAYTAPQAARLAGQLAAAGVSWFEEPVSSDDLGGLAAVRAQVAPDVAAGEYSWSLADSAALLRAGAVDCLQLDVTRCGGVTGFLRAARLAEADGLQVSGHCAPNLHARVAAGVTNLRHVEYFHDHQRLEDMLFDGALRPDGGVLTPDSHRPGFGLELRLPDADRYRVA
ncbi:MAG TPA: enolase C-terminal domain-like protein [Streptosporangiaceae bacterium]